jgi:hypothetical protein
MSSLSLFLVIVLSLFLLNATIKSEIKLETTTDQVSISEWEYCEGCILTVDAYSKISNAKLKEMQQKGQPSNEVIDVGVIMKNMCDNEYFYKYKDFVKYSCIKMLNENSTSFAEPFAGSYDLNSANVKSYMFEKTKEVGNYAYDLTY